MKIKQKRQNLKNQLTKLQHAQLFTSIRQSLIMSRSQTLQNQDTLVTFLLAYEELHKDHPNRLNIYANLEGLIHNILINRQADALLKKVALWLYIMLSCDSEVIEYLASQSFIQEWRRLLFYLKEYSQFQQDFYQRMNILLKLTEAKYSDYKRDQLFQIQTTSILIDLEPPFHQDSNYYDLMQTYITAVPKQHLNPILNSGFALKSLEFSNNAIFLSILARIQAEGEANQQFKEVYEVLLNKKQQFQANIDHDLN